ncbi:MAG: hypothetical protein KGL77_05900 [Actinomycetales bacterium]|nr:hypothetical protein [Actinomycetales bacterium]
MSTETVTPTSPAAATRRGLPVSTWITLAAVVVAIYPQYSHLSYFVAYPQTIGDAFNPSSGFGIGSFQFKDFVLVTLFEPLILIAAALFAFISRNRLVRALPGLLYVLGALVFLGINFGFAAQEGDLMDFSPWQWTFGVGIEAALYVASLVIAAVGSIMALAEKAPAGSASSAAAPAAGRTPVGFDPQTGRPIYGYDVNTGQPIF